MFFVIHGINNNTNTPIWGFVYQRLRSSLSWTKSWRQTNFKKSDWLFRKLGTRKKITLHGKWKSHEKGNIRNIPSKECILIFVRSFLAFTTAGVFGMFWFLYVICTLCGPCRSGVYLYNLKRGFLSS